MRSLSSSETSVADRDGGATMVEYALIVASIAFVVVLGGTIFGNALSSLFSSFVGSV